MKRQCILEHRGEHPQYHYDIVSKDDIVGSGKCTRSLATHKQFKFPHISWKISHVEDKLPEGCPVESLELIIQVSNSE
jgi:hypothetical protein